MKFVFLLSGHEEINAIDQATACLAEALVRRGHEARVVPRAKGPLAGGLADADVLALPYNPFMWGRRGFAPSLVRDVARLRCRRVRPKLALIVHESYIDVRDVKTLLMGGWQRLQLVALLLLADSRYASIQAWANKLSRIRPVEHLPSGSTLPSGGPSRVATRSELGLSDSVVLASLSTGHPSHLTAYVEGALSCLAKGPKAPPLAFLQLGDGFADLVLPASVRAERPGRLKPERLAALLRSTDILLAPFADGVSTRRTSFLAGLQQGVAIVGTTGTLTDPMLESRGLELVPVGNADAFAQRVRDLVDDGARRGEVAEAGRQLFESEFTWDALAERFLSGLHL